MQAAEGRGALLKPYSLQLRDCATRSGSLCSHCRRPWMAASSISGDIMAGRIAVTHFALKDSSLQS